MAAMAAMAADGRSDVGQGLQAKLSQNVAVQTHCLLRAGTPTIATIYKKALIALILMAKS